MAVIILYPFACRNNCLCGCATVILALSLSLSYYPGLLFARTFIRQTKAPNFQLPKKNINLVKTKKKLT